MLRNPLLPFVFACFCPVAPLLLAQTPPAGFPAAIAASPLPFPIDRVLTDQPEDGVVTAVTAAWKAQFDGAGATFVPFLGSARPSLPTTFRLAAASVAGRALPVHDAVPALRDQRVAFARGGVTEVYDLRQDGLEQAFEVRELPARGELRLQLAVRTPLTAVAGGDGLGFADDRGEIVVRYGAAVAIDAAGRRCAVAERWRDGGIELAVPAAFVAEATLPLVVDPLVAVPVTFTPSVAEVGHPAIAFDASLGEYAVVYEASFSATDHDVYLLRYNTSLAYLGTLAIDSTVAFWGVPDVAVVESADSALVVAEKSTGNVSPFVLGTRRVRLGASAFAFAPSALVGGSVDYRRPVVGGDPAPTGTNWFLIACDHEDPSTGEYNVDITPYSSTGVGSWVSPLTVPGERSFGASISKSCGDDLGGGAGWAIVFRSQVVGQALGTLHASIVDRAGLQLRQYQGQDSFALTGATMNLGSDHAVSSPTDAAAGRRFLAVERRSNIVNSNAALVGHVFTADGAVPVAGATLFPGAANHREPTVDCDGARFVVATTARLSATDSDVYLRTFGMVGGQLLQQDDDYVSFSLDYDGQPALCAARGGTRGNYGLTWTHGSVATADMRIQLQRYRGIAATGGFTGRATGCGNLQSTITGWPWVGESFTVTLSNPAGFPGFVLGTPVTAPIAACPACTQGVVGTALLGAQVAVTVPPDASFVGLTLSIQGFRFDLAGQPCLGQIELSNTVDFTVQ